MNDCENCPIATKLVASIQLSDKQADDFQRKMLEIVKIQREQIKDLQDQITTLKEILLCKNNIARN